MHAFLTGSRAYGTPREDSDIDLAVFIPQEQFAAFRGLCKSAEASPSREGDYPNGVAFRFGNLNLLAFWHEPSFIAWRDATAELVARKPVTRDEAIQAIDEKLDRIEAVPVMAEAIEVPIFVPVSIV